MVLRITCYVGSFVFSLLSIGTLLVALRIGPYPRFLDIKPQGGQMVVAIGFAACAGMLRGIARHEEIEELKTSRWSSNDQ